ncbi:unnamed protein product [Paramecium octaurelia]|uniref:Uncharacterized protein n=1 Tax=Paramecium octaurelia TaxID=43137 RepID=A0A8S1VE80_PAROT|nr:unnamed protein product [Paramecium octaurelia]
MEIFFIINKQILVNQFYNYCLFYQQELGNLQQILNIQLISIAKKFLIKNQKGSRIIIKKVTVIEFVVLHHKSNYVQKTQQEYSKYIAGMNTEKYKFILKTTFFKHQQCLLNENSSIRIQMIQAFIFMYG